jgi:hypothetical protein
MSLLTVVEMEEARELIVEVKKSFFHEKTRMEIRFDKTANSTEQIEIRFEQDNKVSGPSSFSSFRNWTDDKIFQSLTSANKAAYTSLPDGSYLKISSSEYTALQTNLSEVTKVSTTDAIFTAANSTGFSTGATFFTNRASVDTPSIPANHFLFAIKLVYSVAISNIRIFANDNPTSYTNFRQIGGALPTTTAGENFYILKGSSTVTATTDGNLALWVSQISGFGYKSSIGANGVRYAFITSVPTSATTMGSSLLLNGAFALQGLTTSRIQWLT